MEVNEITAAEYATRIVAHGGRVSNRLPLIVGRMRFQMLAGLCLAVILPGLMTSFIEFGSSPESLFDPTLFGTLAAFLLGYLLFRKVTGFPGVRASAYILPVFIAAYGIVVATFFLLRIDYSRLQFLMSFFIAVFFFYALFVLVRRLSRMELAIVPIGDISHLLALRFVAWRVLRSPDEPLQGTGLVADLDCDMPKEWERFVVDRALSGAPVYDARHVFESLSGRVQVEHLTDNLLGSLFPSTIYRASKRWIDFVTALCVLIFVWPLLTLCMIVICLETKGPPVFTQYRMGLGGRPFRIFKLRTMRPGHDIEESIEGQKTLVGDPRITPFGKFLRKSRLDELPQVINILRGEMSWIGPRPEALQLSEWYEQNIPSFRYRHIVRPGISGWAQVNQGHVTTLDDIKIKLEYDFFYVKNFSLWLDLLVLLRTIRVVFTGYGAR